MTVLVLAVAWLVVANALAFALMGVDKRRARRRQWRIPERTLLLTALGSGTIGTWLGVLAFRHKRRKPGFLAWLAVATCADAVLAARLLGVSL